MFVDALTFVCIYIHISTSSCIKYLFGFKFNSELVPAVSSRAHRASDVSCAGSCSDSEGGACVTCNLSEPQTARHQDMRADPETRTTSPRGIVM